MVPYVTLPVPAGNSENIRGKARLVYEPSSEDQIAGCRHCQGRNVSRNPDSKGRIDLPIVVKTGNPIHDIVEVARQKIAGNYQFAVSG